MNRIISRLILAMAKPAPVPEQTRPDPKKLVASLARGNVNLKSGRYLTASQVKKQREALAKCSF